MRKIIFILGLSRPSGQAPIAIPIVVLAILFKGAASAQTSPPPPSYQQCTLTNGTLSGIFGGLTASGTYTLGANPNTSIITVSGLGVGFYESGVTYTFTGPADGPGYTQVSQVNSSLNAIFSFYDAGNGIANLSFQDIGTYSGSGNISCTVPPPCPVNNSATRGARSDASPAPNNCSCPAFSVHTQGNGTKVMFARYTPADTPGSPMRLKDVALACNYAGFDWQQQTTNLPCPSVLQPTKTSAVDPSNLCGYYSTTNPAFALTPNGLTVAMGASPPFFDPPDGGYKIPSLAGYDPNPYYYYVDVAHTAGTPVMINGVDHSPLDPADQTFQTHLPAVNNDTFLAMSDAPNDPCLPPGSSALPPNGCGLVYAPKDSYVGFTTYLVGVSNDGKNTPVPLKSFTWRSNYNGTTGGVSGLLSSPGTPDPGSGVGYITITSIDGVPVPQIVPMSEITTTASGLAYSRVTKTFNGTVSITNISDATISTPTSFQLALNSLTAGVTLVNSMGTFNQGPYITIPALVSMFPGQSVTVAVQFSNPSNATINFTPEFYAGSFQ